MIDPNTIPRIVICNKLYFWKKIEVPIPEATVPNRVPRTDPIIMAINMAAIWIKKLADLIRKWTSKIQEQIDIPIHWVMMKVSINPPPNSRNLRNMAIPVLKRAV